jgi:hypothetical protein
MRRYLAGAGTVGLLKIVKGLKMTNRDVCVDFASEILMYSQITYAPIVSHCVIVATTSIILKVRIMAMDSPIGLESIALYCDRALRAGVQLSVTGRFSTIRS